MTVPKSSTKVYHAQGQLPMSKPPDSPVPKWSKSLLESTKIVKESPRLKLPIRCKSAGNEERADQSQIIREWILHLVSDMQAALVRFASVPVRAAPGFGSDGPSGERGFLHLSTV